MTFLATALDHVAMFEQWTLCTVLDVPDAEFAEQPAGLSNHPAWVLGHLTYAMDNITRQLGGEVPREESWYTPFTGGTEPTSKRSAYPSKDDLIVAFADSCARIRRVVAAADEATFDAPVQDERIAAFFPTMGRWIVHAMMIEGPFHTGQLSAWRRARDMPSVFTVEGNLARMMTASA